ncbi:hypothetical protein ACSYAD_23385 [Acaryochloris marina NIES-2412]|uniref:hypothetical protein n=1 Tax=Acaryochloris marina TaxID=155978 RepID=UPI004057E175
MSILDPGVMAAVMVVSSFPQNKQETLLSKKAAMAELKKTHQLDIAFAQRMSADQVRALLYAVREQDELADAIRALIEQRSRFAKNNRSYGLVKYRIENERDYALNQLNYVEQQLEKYQQYFKELLRNFLDLEQSELLRLVRTLLAQLD